MTQRKSVQETPQMKFSNFEFKNKYKYELEVRVKLTPYLANKRDPKKRMGEVLSFPKEENNKKTLTGELGKILKPGHVFFVLRVKDEKKAIKEESIGFSFVKKTNKTINPAENNELVRKGFVQDQEKENPLYDYKETFDISQDNFKNTIKFVEDKIKNPPEFLWPTKYNCVKFTKKAVDAAGLNGDKIIGLSNLPTETAILIKTRKTKKEIIEIMKKRKKRLSNKLIKALAASNQNRF